MSNTEGAPDRGALTGSVRAGETIEVRIGGEVIRITVVGHTRRGSNAERTRSVLRVDAPRSVGIALPRNTERDECEQAPGPLSKSFCAYLGASGSLQDFVVRLKTAVGHLRDEEERSKATASLETAYLLCAMRDGMEKVLSGLRLYLIPAQKGGDRDGH